MSDLKKPKAKIKDYLKGAKLPESYVIYKRYEAPRESRRKKVNLIPYNGELRRHHIDD